MDQLRDQWETTGKDANWMVTREELARQGTRTPIYTYRVRKDTCNGKNTGKINGKITESWVSAETAPETRPKQGHSAPLKEQQQNFLII